MHCKRISINVMRQSACLVINPITVDSFASLFNCTCIRLIDGPNIKLVDLFKFVGTGLSLVCCLVIWVSTGGFLCSGISVVFFHILGFSRYVSQYVSVESSFFSDSSKALFVNCLFPMLIH